MSSGISGVGCKTLVGEVNKSPDDVGEIGQQVQNELVAECKNSGVDEKLTAETKGAFAELWDCLCLTCSRAGSSLSSFGSIIKENFADSSRSFWSNLGHSITGILVKIKDLNISGDSALEALAGTLLKAAIKTLVLVAYIVKGLSGVVNSIIDEVGVNHTDKTAVDKTSKQSKDAGKVLVGIGLASTGAALGYVGIGIAICPEIEKIVPKVVEGAAKIEKKIDEFCGFNNKENTNVSAKANMADNAENVDARDVETKTA